MKNNDVILRKSNLSPHYYETSDINITSYLSTAGHKLVSFKSTNQKFIFVFEDSEKLQQDILDFYNHTARVDPLDFAQTLRNFKSMVRNQ